MENPIIVIAGPTASGKTAMGIELAKKFAGEVINADSRSIYVGLDMGSGKPTVEEMSDVPHHLFDIVTPDKTFNFFEWRERAIKKITEIQKRNKIPFIVGATGLYIDSLVYSYETDGLADITYRKKMDKKSADELYDILKQKDKSTAKTIDPNNKRRIIRALEIFHQTGKSKVLQEKRKKKPSNILYLALEVPREELYNKINQRVENWMKKGFEGEVKKLLAKYTLLDPGMTGIGYRQIGLFLTGQITREQAIEKFKQGDRNLAKRQLTWLRRNTDVVWIRNSIEAEKEILKFI